LACWRACRAAAALAGGSAAHLASNVAVMVQIAWTSWTASSARASQAGWLLELLDAGTRVSSGAWVEGGCAAKMEAAREYRTGILGLGTGEQLLAAGVAGGGARDSGRAGPAWARGCRALSEMGTHGWDMLLLVGVGGLVALPDAGLEKPEALPEVGMQESEVLLELRAGELGALPEGGVRVLVPLPEVGLVDAAAQAACLHMMVSLYLACTWLTALSSSSCRCCTSRPGLPLRR
jgi:hypothetical protein